MRSIGTQCPRRPLGDKKKLSEKERGHPLEFLSDNYADAADICRTFCSNTPHPLEFYADVRRMSIGRPPECLSDVRQNVHRTSAEFPSDVRQNFRHIRQNHRRTSARMSAGCPLECVGHQPECPMDVCQTSAMSAQKNVCKNSFRVTSPLV